jgi:hypothetical protein
METFSALIAHIVKIDGIVAMRTKDCLGVLYGTTAIAHADLATAAISADRIRENSGFAVGAKPFGVLLQAGTA